MIVPFRQVAYAALLLLVSPTVLVGQTGAPEWVLTPEVRLETDAIRFRADASALLIQAADGRVILSARRGGTPIHVFGEDGALLRSIPLSDIVSEGIDEISGIGFLGDTLWIVDGGRSQIIYVGPDFEPYGILPFSPPVLSAGHLPSAPHRILADSTGLYRPGVIGEMAADGIVDRLPLLRVDFRRGVSDTILVRPFAHSWLAIRGPRAAITFMGQPFGDDPIIESSPNGQVIIVTERPGGDSTFTVRRLDPAGDTVMVVTCLYTPQPIPAARLAEEIEVNVATVVEFGTLPPAEARAAVKEQLYVPAALTPITQVIAGNDASVWLRRELVNSDSVDWNVLGSDGNLIGTVSHMRDSRILAADREGVWAIMRAEGERASIVRFTAEPSGATSTDPQC